MKNKFYVWVLDFGKSIPTPHDILPYLSQEWRNLKPKERGEATKDLQDWVKKKLLYQYWSRCQYEMLVLPWPTGPNDKPEKVDVYDQCLPNLELITRLFSENEEIA